MFQSGGLYFPDGEKHFTQFGDSVVQYQQCDRDAAYAYVRSWRRVLDVGANVGIFARDFATKFEEVVAFEPMPPARECLALNIPPNVRIEPFAVADQLGVLEMYPTVKNCGGSFISNHPQIMVPEEVQLKRKRAVEVEVRTIDSFNFDAVDLIKLDVQGAEYAALIGARETIVQHRPVIMIEEKAFSEEHAEFIKKAADLLVSYGMTPKEKAQSDRVYVFDH